MSKIWKWIFGILLVMVIVAAFAMAGYAWRTHSYAMASYRSAPFDGQGQPFDRNWNGPMMGRGDDNWGQPHMWQRDDGWQHPMIYERGFSSYHSGFFLLGRLVHLILFFGLLYGAYWLGRRNARITLDPKTVAPVAQVPAPQADSAPAPRGRAKKTG